MHRHSTFRGMEYDARTAATLTLDLMNSPSGLVLVATDEDGRGVGMLLAMVTNSFFGSDRVASDLALFVHPDARGKQAAVGMIERYVEWAKSLGARRINLGNSAGMDDEVYVRLTEGCGFVRAGSLMYLGA